MPLQDTDNLIVGRGDTSYKLTYEDLKDKLEEDGLGGGGGKPGVITKQPTLSADNEGFAPCTLTATEAEVANATKSAVKWYLDDSEIAGATALTYSATQAGTYKYEETWVSDDGTVLKPSATIVVNTLTIKKPEVLTPPDGAGIGGDTTYTPETSAIAAGGVEANTGYGEGPYINNDGIAYLDYGLYLQDGTAISDRDEQMKVWKDQAYYNANINDTAKNGNKGLYAYATPIRFTYNGMSPGDQIQVVLGSATVAGGTITVSGEVEPVSPIYFAVSKDEGPKNAVTITVTSTTGEIIFTPQTDADNTLIHYMSPLSTKGVVKLTLTDDKAYDSEDGTEMTTIDQAFKAGDKVKAKSDSSITGVLTEDAAGTSMTLSDVTGEWKDGLTAVNQTEATETAPGADDIVFTSSQPATTSGTVNSWGQAEWELSVDSGFVDKQESSVFLADSNPELGPTNFTLEADTEYWVRTKYNSADPEAVSEWSDSTKFKTAGKEDGWFGINVGDSGNNWSSVVYGNGTFVTVDYVGTNRVMYSSDGIDWTPASASEQNSWTDVTFGDGKFVAVATTGTNRVMHSTDGITWTAAPAISGDYYWTSVTYGNGKFVAVAPNGANRVMHSSDAVTWTAASAASDAEWQSITFGNGKFVAVGWKAANSIMHSTDGITWTGAQPPLDSVWTSVTYGGGKFVAVTYTGGLNRVIVSSDGVTWQVSAASETNHWQAVTYGDGKFVAVAYDGTNQVMYSTDGYTWLPSAAPAGDWRGVCYGGDKFIAVGYAGGSYTVMYSFTGTGDPATTLFYDENNAEAVNNVTLERRYGVDPLETDLKKYGIFPLTEQPTYSVAAYIKEGNEYNPIRSYEGELNRANTRIAELQTSFEARMAALEADHADMMDDDNNGGY